MVNGSRGLILTADRSLMTNYRGQFPFGFIACGPYELVPEFVFDEFFCPSVETDKGNRGSQGRSMWIEEGRGRSAQGCKALRISLSQSPRDARKKCVGPGNQSSWN